MNSREHLNRLWFNAVRILYGYARQNIGVVLVVGFCIFCIVTSVLVPMHSLFYFLYGTAWTIQVLCSDVESIGEISSQEGVSKVTDTPSSFSHNWRPYYSTESVFSFQNQDSLLSLCPRFVTQTINISIIMSKAL